MSKKSRSGYGYLIRSAVAFLVLQILLAGTFAFGLAANASVRPENCETVEIVIKDDYFIHRSRHADIYTLVAEDGAEYRFPNVSQGCSNGEHYARKIDEKINVGDKVSVTYVETFWFFGSYREIVDARTDGGIYLKKADYFEHRRVNFPAFLCRLRRAGVLSLGWSYLLVGA